VELTRALMEKNEKIASAAKNNNSEEEDWEQKFTPYISAWTYRQANLFKKVVKLLDNDRLARLSICGPDQKASDIVRMRTIIDKSAERMRKELAAVSWEVTIVQWLHTLLMEHLPPSILAAYLDIMQTLKAKVPSLVDKMIFWKPGNVNQELLAPILKKPWQPSLTNKVIYFILFNSNLF
jgi:regulatory NSL complex subunit 3